MTTTVWESAVVARALASGPPSRPKIRKINTDEHIRSQMMSSLEAAIEKQSAQERAAKKKNGIDENVFLAPVTIFDPTPPWEADVPTVYASNTAAMELPTLKQQRYQPIHTPGERPTMPVPASRALRRISAIPTAPQKAIEMPQKEIDIDVDVDVDVELVDEEDQRETLDARAAKLAIKRAKEAKSKSRKRMLFFTIAMLTVLCAGISIDPHARTQARSALSTALHRVAVAIY